MKEEKIYIGITAWGCLFVLNKELNDLKHKHIKGELPFVFAWGYLGDAPAHTALSILSDYLGKDMRKTPAVYQKFKFDIVAHLKPRFALRGKDIQRWLDKNPDYKEMVTSLKPDNRQPR